MSNGPGLRRPNILWVSFEDTSPRYGCYGDALARTPNVDRLAAEGCRYNNAFSVAPVCAPSRSAIITGVYPTWAGTHHMRTTHTNPHLPELPTPYEAVVPHYVKCFTEYLRSEGYYCTNNDKTDYQFEAPLSAWDACSKTAHWRHRPSADQPFFSVFNPIYTHESGMWPDKEPGREIETDPGAVEVPPYLPDTLEVRKAVARQYDNIARNDAVLGQLMKELEEDGLLEDTIIFHWSDHGEGLPRGKRWPYDRGIRIPLIVRWPKGLRAGAVSEDLVSLIDLAPTVLSLCGVQRPVHLQGQVFLGPEADAPRQHIFATRDRYDEFYDMVRAVRSRRFKYIRNYRPDLPYLGWIPYRNHHPAMRELWERHATGRLEAFQELLFQKRPPEELYDTQYDPWELHNLADDPEFKDELAQHREVMDAWRSRYDSYGDVPEAEMVKQWYPDGVQPTTAAPIAIPLGRDLGAGVPMENEGSIDLPGDSLIQLQSATQGASISYTLEAGDTARWLLYTAPFQLQSGTYHLRAQAARIGYKPSQIHNWTVVIG